MGTVNDGCFTTGTGIKKMFKNERLPVPVIIGNTPIEFMAAPDMPDEPAFRAFAQAAFGENAEEFLKLTAGVDYDEIKKNATFNCVECGSRCVATASMKKDLPVYYYQFNPYIPGPDHPGPFHSCDLWFWFETLAACWRPYTGKHYDLARQMSGYLVNFVKTGDPNGEDANGEQLPLWKTYNESEAPLYFGEKPVMKTKEDESELMKFLVSQYVK